MSGDLGPRDAASERPDPASDGEPHRDERARIGIATVLFFIGTVLLAGLASGVLFNTGLELRGAAASEDDVPPPGIVSVVGKRDSAANGLTDLEVYFVQPAGAADLDLSSLHLLVADGRTSGDYSYASSAGADTFTATGVRDPDRSIAGPLPVASAGDLVRIDLRWAPGDGRGILPGADVTLTLVPSEGRAVAKVFQAPQGFDATLVVPLV